MNPGAQNINVFLIQENKTGGQGMVDRWRAGIQLSPGSEDSLGSDPAKRLMNNWG